MLCQKDKSSTVPLQNGNLSAQMVNNAVILSSASASEKTAATPLYSEILQGHQVEFGCLGMLLYAC